MNRPPASVPSLMKTMGSVDEREERHSAEHGGDGDEARRVDNGCRHLQHHDTLPVTRIDGLFFLFSPPPRTASQCARNASPACPSPTFSLTAPTDAQRPRCTSPPAPRPTACRSRSHHCRLDPIRSPRPRNVRSRSDHEPDNDRADTPATTPIEGLFYLSSGRSPVLVGPHP